MTAARVIILVMDSVGIGAAHDAARYDDAGADTLGHIVEEAAAGRADQRGLRQGLLALPNLAGLGLAACVQACRGAPLASNLGAEVGPSASYGYAAPASAPKGSTGGHWEIAGLPTIRDWGYFGLDPEQPYPAGLLDQLIDACALPGVIEVGRASGTEVIARHGEAHMRSGQPIVYTSADSVLQVAAHETCFGLDRLFEVCRVARDLCDAHRIARVIARPFVGESADDFSRTENRRDFAMPPHEQTLLDRLHQAGRQVITIGKIGDLFAHRGISREYSVTELNAVFDQTLASMSECTDRSLLFVNFCDFDSKYGHRRDVTGYAHELERFDQRLPEVLVALTDDDLLIVTADHGNDPTFRGSDHTREYVPVLITGAGIAGGDFGRRATFADVGATAAQHLGLAEWGAGQPIAVESSE